MIIGHEMMVQLGLYSNFNHTVSQWDGATAPIKLPSGMIGKTYLTSRKMCKVVMRTAEPVSTRENNERLV